jgi:hypothetical protein
MNFRDRNRELSVFLADETTVERVLAGHAGFGIVELAADDVRQRVPGALLCRDPEPDPAHALICGKVTQAQAAQLARVCQWVVKPLLSTAPPAPDAG